MEEDKTQMKVEALVKRWFTDELFYKIESEGFTKEDLFYVLCYLHGFFCLERKKHKHLFEGKDR